MVDFQSKNFRGKSPKTKDFNGTNHKKSETQWVKNEWSSRHQGNGWGKSQPTIITQTLHKDTTSSTLKDFNETKHKNSDPSLITQTLQKETTTFQLKDISVRNYTKYNVRYLLVSQCPDLVDVNNKTQQSFYRKQFDNLPDHFNILDEQWIKSKEDSEEKVADYIDIEIINTHNNMNDNGSDDGSTSSQPYDSNPFLKSLPYNFIFDYAFHLLNK